MIIASFGDNKEVEDDGFTVIEADSSFSSEDADTCAHANDMSPVHSIDKELGLHSCSFIFKFIRWNN